MAEMKRQDETREDIEAIVIGPGHWDSQKETERIEDFEALAKYEGDTGFGLEQLPGFQMWTRERVYVKEVYDGAEAIRSVPRTPTVNEDPKSIGGG